MLVLLLSAALVFSPEDARLAYTVATELVERHTPRDAGTGRGRSAAFCILDRASAAGADVRLSKFRADTPHGKLGFTNLIAEFVTDPTNDWVVVVSHYDTKSGIACPGANDGASTSGILVGLANALSSWRERRGNVMLLWTDGEECMEHYGENDGFWGSRKAARDLAESARTVRAVICIDMLGDSDLSVFIPRNGSKALAKIALLAAKRSGVGEKTDIETKEIVKDDHVPFLERGFKAIDLIDFDYGPGNAYWHTKDDTLDHISEDSLLKSGKLIAEMLNILL